MEVNYKEVLDKLIGAWESVDGQFYFMFSAPRTNYLELIMTFKQQGKRMVNVPYFLNYIPIDRIGISPSIPVEPFNHGGNIIVDFIDDNTLELKYYETIYTLSRMTDGIESVFSL